MKKEIEVQKIELEKLREDKTKTNEVVGFKSEKVNDFEELETLEGWLNLYSDLGYSMEEYYKLWEKGMLEEKMKEEGYTEIACNHAKEYIEKNKDSLVKKRVRFKK